MQQMAAQAQGGPSHPQHGKELCLLSLDGGGVRGLSSLCILEELMRKVDPGRPPRPSEYFDLIGGTSTGGLIAIMLGRLQMSIEDCRQAYRELSDEAFQLKNYQASPAFRMPWNWDLKARFDSAALERGIKRIIVRELRRDPGNDAKSDKELEDTLLKDKQAKCKVFVTATSASLPDRTSILTNYESDRWPRDLLDSVKIWEAARATSAASTFFEPIKVGPDNEEFLDGATGANNPVNVVWDEARDMWPSDNPLEDDVQCMVSIGTGVPTVKAFGSSLKEVGMTLKDQSTETETTAEAFLRRYTRLHSENRYFRFNVLSGLGDIGLEEAARRSEIVQATRRYLSSEEPKKNLENCAKNLRFREWYKALPRIIERAAQEHATATDRLKEYGTNPEEEFHESHKWFVNMPEYRQWLKSGRGVLCYLDSDDVEMSALISDIVKKELPSHPALSKVIYLDCSQYNACTVLENERLDVGSDDGSDKDASEVVHMRAKKSMLLTEMGAIHSLIYQNIHLHPGSLERLLEFFKTLRQPASRSFNRLFHEEVNVDDTPDCDFMVDALTWVMPDDPRGSFTIIDKIDLMHWAAWRSFLEHLRSKIDESDHVLFLGHDGPSLREKLRGFQSINTEVETLHCIHSLHFEEWDDRRSIVETPFRDTDDWVWTHPAFPRWMEKSGILWIKGKPGSGKSTIARMVTDKLAGPKEHQPSDSWVKANDEQVPTIAANFFYSARMGEKATRHHYMLRSVLYQMLRQDHSLYEHFRPIYRNLLAQNLQETDTKWTLENLMLVFEAIVQDCSFERPSLCCILDGFDESDENDCAQAGPPRSKKTQILSWLADLALKQTEGSWLKVLVLSRPTTSISRALGTMAKITVEDHNLPAIKKLVEDGLAKMKQSITEWIRRDCGGYPDAEQYIRAQQNDADATLQHLRTRILEKADGTIQWVVTVLGELQSQFDRKGVYTRGELEEVLDTLPKGLDELYEELVKRLQKRLTATELRKAHNMLAWACFARRPLTLDEFRDALALDGWKESSSLDQLPKHLEDRRLRLLQKDNWAPVEREIVDTCGCLLEVVKPTSASIKLRPGMPSWGVRADCTVQVTHQTVKEFLFNEDKAGPLKLANEQCSSYISIGISIYFRSSVRLLECALAEFVDADLRDSSVNLNSLAAYPKSAFESVAYHLQDRPLLAYILATTDCSAANKDLFTSAHPEIQELMDYFVKERSRSSIVKEDDLPRETSRPPRPEDRLEDRPEESRRRRSTGADEIDPEIDPEYDPEFDPEYGPEFDPEFDPEYSPEFDSFNPFKPFDVGRYNEPPWDHMKERRRIPPSLWDSDNRFTSPPLEYDDPVSLRIGYAPTRSKTNDSDISLMERGRRHVESVEDNRVRRRGPQSSTNSATSPPQDAAQIAENYDADGWTGTSPSNHDDVSNRPHDRLYRHILPAMSPSNGATLPDDEDFSHLQMIPYNFHNPSEEDGWNEMSRHARSRAERYRIQTLRSTSRLRSEDSDDSDRLTRGRIISPSSSESGDSARSIVVRRRHSSIEGLRFGPFGPGNPYSKTELDSTTRTESHSLLRIAVLPTANEAAKLLEQKFEEMYAQIFFAACGHSLFTVLRLLFELKLCKELHVKNQCIKAITEGNLAVADELLPRANFSVTTAVVSYHPLASVLANIVKKDEDETVRLLLHHQPSLVNESDEDYLTALHFAASHNSEKSTVALLERKAYIDAADCTDRTPLIVAARRGYGPMVELLLDRGANYALRDSGGHTALYHAVCSGDKRSIRALLSRGHTCHCVVEALEAALDTYVEGGFKAENETHHRNFGLLKRRLSWPSTPDFSQATCSRRDYEKNFLAPRRQHTWHPQIDRSLVDSFCRKGDGTWNLTRRQSLDNFELGPTPRLRTYSSPKLTNAKFLKREGGTLLSESRDPGPPEPFPSQSISSLNEQKSVSHGESEEDRYSSRSPRRSTLQRTLSESDLDALVASPRSSSSFPRGDSEDENLNIEISLPRRGVMGTVWPGASRLPRAQLPSGQYMGSKNCLRQDSVD